MYAIPARTADGDHVQLELPCPGDGNLDDTCGLPLLFSHDEIKGDTVHRYASCSSRHTWSFTCSLSEHQPIEGVTPGTLEDNLGDYSERPAPPHVRVMLHGGTALQRSVAMADLALAMAAQGHTVVVPLSKKAKGRQQQRPKQRTKR